MTNEERLYDEEHWRYMRATDRYDLVGPICRWLISGSVYAAAVPFTLWVFLKGGAEAAWDMWT